MGSTCYCVCYTNSRYLVEQPVVTDFSTDQMTSEWEEVTLTCTADHASYVTWHRQGGDLSDTTIITTDTSGGNYVVSKEEERGGEGRGEGVE